MQKRSGRARSRAGRVLLTGLVVGLPAGLCALLGAAYVALGALPPVPVPPENPMTEAKRVLGKILFWDEQLSTSNVVSCGTCHMPQNAGTDPRLARNPGLDGLLNTPDDIQGSPGVIRSDVNNDYVRDPVFGIGPQITGRSANSPINAAYAVDLFWDGRARSQFRDPETNQVAIVAGGALESQAVGPVTNSVEMAHDNIDWGSVTAKLRRVNPLDLATAIPADVSSALADRPSYPELFRRAFGDDTISARRIGFAIATYQRTLIADQTPWDRFDAGDVNALTLNQRQGLQAMQANNCLVCHAPPLFSDNTFRNIGLRPVQEDLGRQIVTGNAADRGKFKVPSLRNTGLKRTYMHNGQFTNLGQVIGFYARAPGSPPQFPDNRDPLMLQTVIPPQAVPQVQDFMQNGLTDPRVANRQFPFDAPVMVADRPEHRATLLGAGVAGSGGIAPRMIAQAPPMLGNMQYRLGVEGALGNANATLAISTQPPVAGRITPQMFVGIVRTSGAGAGNGVATIHWPLLRDVAQPGQTLYAQWIVTDAAAPGGQAMSNVAAIPFFCGTYGCPPCPADFNASGGTPDDADVASFFEAWGAGDERADLNFSGGSPDDADVAYFFERWGLGC
ncbi:MAG: hypothetical protein HUU18_07625 [Phycisphaerales bacterium]|nr:hypothetical protein [Phycisphaerales bacterium]